MIQIAIAVWIRAGENKHLHPARGTVAGGREVCIIDAAAVLGISLHCVISEAASAKVIALEISRRFGKAELVKFVVHPVVPVKKVHQRARHQRLAERVDR